MTRIGDAAPLLPDDSGRGRTHGGEEREGGDGEQGAHAGLLREEGSAVGLDPKLATLASRRRKALGFPPTEQIAFPISRA